jgi:hypothetical protein
MRRREERGREKPLITAHTWTMNSAGVPENPYLSRQPTRYPKTTPADGFVRPSHTSTSTTNITTTSLPD